MRCAVHERHGSDYAVRMRLWWKEPRKRGIYLRGGGSVKRYGQRVVIKTTQPAKLDVNDPRLSIVIAAEALRADDVWTKNGWRKAPAQCPILCAAIEGASTAEVLALLDAWTQAYRARCQRYENAAVAEIEAS
jgi:hypothetical protein